MGFKQKRGCVLYAIIALFLALVYSYKNAIWVNEQYAMYFKRGDTSTPIYLMLVYSALLVIFIVAVTKICENRTHFLYGAILILTILFYFVKSLLEEGVYSAFTSPTTSLVYLLILAIFIGADDEIWASIRMFLPFLIVGYICLLGYEHVTLVARYGIVVVGNSSLIYYYVSLFWCSTIYLTDRILQKKNIGLRQILLMGFNIVFAVIINSRSWIIQSCLVAVVIYLYLMVLLLIGLLVAPARDFWLSRQRFEYRYKLSGTMTVLSAVAASGLAVAAVLYANSIGFSDIASVRLFANYSIIYGVAFVIWLSIFLKGRSFYSAKYWKFSLQLSLPLIGYSIASQILSVSDRLMISKMVGNSAVGVYSTLYTVSSLSLMVWTAINASFEPYLYQNMENPKSKIKKLSMSMLGMYSLVAILLVYLAPEIVRILATEEYYKGIYIMPSIAGGVYFIAVSNLYSDILVYLKKTKMVMISSAIAAALNVVLNYIMINAYGYMAAAYTTLISYIVMALLLSIWANREFKKHITEIDFVYDNKLILAISVMTLVVSLFAVAIYDYAIVRYAVAAVIFIATALYGIHYLKENKDMKKGRS